MSRMRLDEMAGRIEQALAQTALAPAVRKVSVEPADDLDDDTLLRVLVSVYRPDKVDAKIANQVVRQVRMDLMADDDRFLMFQFPEAA